MILITPRGAVAAPAYTIITTTLSKVHTQRCARNRTWS